MTNKPTWQYDIDGYNLDRVCLTRLEQMISIAKHGWLATIGGCLIASPVFKATGGQGTNGTPYYTNAGNDSTWGGDAVCQFLIDNKLTWQERHYGNIGRFFIPLIRDKWRYHELTPPEALTALEHVRHKIRATIRANSKPARWKGFYPCGR